MSAEKRLLAADAFWREEQADAEMQHLDAVVTIARRLNFRAKSVHALPVERKARHLSQLSDVSEAVATRALISYHFTVKRDLMAAFLDALEIKHDNGLINEESVPAPSRERAFACFSFFTVSTPKPTGIPISRATVASPAAASRAMCS